MLEGWQGGVLDLSGQPREGLGFNLALQDYGGLAGLSLLGAVSPAGLEDGSWEERLVFCKELP